MLSPGQDPDGLAARVAYHLHRTGKLSTALTSVGFVEHRNIAADITQGRFPLTPNDVQQLAALLGIPAAELTRPLTDQETGAWRFYRTAAAQPNAVWERVGDLLKQHELTIAAAAKVMHIRPSLLTNALTAREPTRILSYDAAERLAKHLNLDDGIDALITIAPDPDDYHSR